MGFLDRFKEKKSMGELDDDLDRLTVEDEILSKEAEKAEKEAIIAELRKKYGPSWMKTLGINKLMDLQSLRGFLKQAKQGMEKSSSMGGSPLSEKLNPGNFRGIKRA